MKECIRRRQATITEFTAIRTIFELCTEAEMMGGASRVLRWWQQDHSAGDDDVGVEDDVDG